MKKIAVSIAAALLLAGVAAASAFAAETPAGRLTGPGFADENRDGVCDNYAAGRGAGCVDEDGDGVCDNYAAGCGRQAGRRGRNS